MAEHVRSLVGALANATQELARASSAAASASAQPDTASAQQSDSTRGAAAGVQEFSVSIAHVAEHTSESEAVTGQALALSREGEDVVHRASEAMQSIAEFVRTGVTTVRALEAARAGEYGRAQEAMCSIASATAQQKSASEASARSVEHIAQTAETSRDAFRQVGKALEVLDGIAAELMRSVARLRLA